MAKKSALEQLVDDYNDKFVAVFTGTAYFIRMADGLTQYQFQPDIVNPLFREHLKATLSIAQLKELTAYAKDTARPYKDAKRYIMIHDRIWDTTTADYTDDCPHPPIYHVPYQPLPSKEADNYLLQLANGDPERVNDIVQTVAPIFLNNKPTGMIWWQGRAANGKSAFMNAIYKLFPNDTVRQLTSVGVDVMEDKRDLTRLNGALANVVRESSDVVKIEDGGVYKSLGTREDVQVHEFYKQGGLNIDANLHHIFNTNVMPIFADKGSAIARRTHMVRFENTFTPDETFEQRTFTPAFLQGLLYRFLEAAKNLHANGSVYQFSKPTVDATMEYRDSANSAVTFIRELVANGVVYFTGMQPVLREYENWCGFNGFSPLGRSHLRNAVLDTGGFIKSTFRQGDKHMQVFRREGVTVDLHSCEVIAPGIFAKRDRRRKTTVVDDERTQLKIW